MSAVADFHRHIETFFGGGKCFLLAKGRVGLYVGLRALGLPHGARVLMPGYTCMVVPSAVGNAGLKPVYVDIDPNTYNLDPALLGSAGEDVAAVIVQHTYGIPCDMAAIGAWADAKAAPVIEDACHTFGSRTGGRLCGTFGVFAFMSGQWNKPFSSGLGGILLVNDPRLAQRAERIIDDEALSPGPAKNLLLGAQIVAHRLLVRPATALAVMSLYRLLNRFGLVVGSSSQEELEGAMPRDYLTTMAPAQVRQGLRELARIDENIRRRKEWTAYYQAELPRYGFEPLQVALEEETPLLRYPVRVANKEEVLKSAARHGVEIGSWFEIPLHPEGTRMEALGYRPGMCPNAEAACRQTINLPTHRKVGLATAERTLRFLKERARPVE